MSNDGTTRDGGDGEEESHLAAYLLAHSSDNALPDPRGRTFVGLSIVREIGRGAYGVVYEAIRTTGTPHERVAVKVLTAAASDSEARKRFKREMRTLQRLKHPHIVKVSQFGADEAYFEMEYVEGSSIDKARIWPKAGAKTPEEVGSVVRFLEKVASAVGYAHRQGVVHRDLKPQNILVDLNGYPRVCDFGLAKWYPPLPEDTHTLTLKGTVRGTIPYLSPEQARNQDAGPQADVWALGMILFEALTGGRAYDVSAPDVIERIASQTENVPLELIASRDHGLGEIASRCLSKDLKSRYKNGVELQKDLLAWLEKRPLPSRPKSSWLVRALQRMGFRRAVEHRN